MKHKKLVILIVLISLFVVAFAIFYAVPKKLNNNISFDIVVYDTDEEKVEAYDEIHIIHINKNIGVRQYRGKDSTNVPFTIYSFDNIYSLKSTQKLTNNLVFYGGLTPMRFMSIIVGNDFPLINEVYLVFSPIITNDRIKLGDLSLHTNYCKEHLEGYDLSKPIEEQNENILAIYNRYKKAIDNVYNKLT